MYVCHIPFMRSGQINMVSFTYQMVEVQPMNSIDAVAMEMAVGSCTTRIPFVFGWV